MKASLVLNIYDYFKYQTTDTIHKKNFATD